MSKKKKLKHKITGAVARWFIRAFARLSLKNCHRIGAFFGWILYRVPNRHRFVSRINLELCFPEMSQKEREKLLQKNLIEAGKQVTEISPIWNWPAEKLFATIKKVEGEAILEGALQQNKGVILASPHVGCWEIIAMYLSSKYPITFMYTVPNNEQLDEIIKAGRTRFLGKQVPTSTRGIAKIIQNLKKNELVSFMPDQEPMEGNGIFAPFFGIQCYSITLVTRLARKTGAPVISVYAKRLQNGAGYELVFTQFDKICEGSIEESVTYMNAQFEKVARALPEQYQWSYKRFRKLPPEKIAQGIVHDPYFH